MDNTNSKSEIVALWLPTFPGLTLMDLDQPEPLMKLSISIKQYSRQYHTIVLIDSAATLNFVSRDFLKRNNLLGRCIRGQKIVVRIANEQRIFTTKTFSPTNVSICQKKVTGHSLTVLPQLKCVDFIFGLPAMKKLNMSIQPSKKMVLDGDIPFLCESQPHRVSCLLVESSKMHKIFAKAARSKHI